MKIEAPEENKIVVRLTADDMTKLHITYEEMDYANIETRRVIWTLLDEARRELGRDIDPSGRMLIEALPEMCIRDRRNSVSLTAAYSAATHCAPLARRAKLSLRQLGFPSSGF